MIDCRFMMISEKKNLYYSCQWMQIAGFVTLNIFKGKSKFSRYFRFFSLNIFKSIDDFVDLIQYTDQ